MNDAKITTGNLLIAVVLICFQFLYPSGVVLAAPKLRHYTLDVNEDGINENIYLDDTSGEVRIVDSAGLTLASGSNLAVDGYSVFDGIRGAGRGKNGFLIVNRGANFGAYIKNLISFTDNDYFLTNISASIENNIDGIIYSHVYCEIKTHVPFNGISADSIEQVILPVTDKKFSQRCSENLKSYFNFSELESLTKSGKISWTIKSADYFINNNKINKNNVETYNNIAYYIFKLSPQNPTSHYILEKVISLYPDRAVAHFNIADYLLINGKCTEAKVSYDKYISIMKKNGHSNQIPKRVLDYQLTNMCIRAHAPPPVSE